jgi:hypothetical protein
MAVQWRLEPPGVTASATAPAPARERPVPVAQAHDTAAAPVPADARTDALVRSIERAIHSLDDFYIVSVGALSLHLYHGLWSVFATLGVENPRLERIRRPTTAIFAWGLFLGYALVPLSVLAGILGLEG